MERPRKRISWKSSDAVGVANGVEAQWANGKEKGGVDIAVWVALSVGLVESCCDKRDGRCREPRRIIVNEDNRCYSSKTTIDQYFLSGRLNLSFW